MDKFKIASTSDTPRDQLKQAQRSPVRYDLYGKGWKVSSAIFIVFSQTLSAFLTLIMGNISFP